MRCIDSGNCDVWQHDLVLEKIPADDGLPLHAQCLAGKRSCPSEDCGGMGGYEALLRIVIAPAHPDHDDMCMWLPEDYNPEEFSLDTINAELMRLR